MPWSTAATFGAVAAILSASVSWPLTTYLSRHGCANGLAVAQFSRMLVKPMSLPPICSVTICVSVVSALNCGGFVTGGDVLGRGHVVGLRAAAGGVGQRAAECRGGQMGEVVVRAQAAERAELLVGDQRPRGIRVAQPAQSAAEAPPRRR